MKRLLLALLLPIVGAAHAQPALPVSKSLWGASGERVEAWVLRAPGFTRARARSAENTTFVTYDRVSGGNEAVVYGFENDSLVQVSRIVFAAEAARYGPLAGWESVGTNEWLVPAENIWIRRIYDGQFIRDTMRRIR